MCIKRSHPSNLHASTVTTKPESPRPSQTATQSSQSSSMSSIQLWNVSISSNANNAAAIMMNAVSKYNETGNAIFRNWHDDVTVWLQQQQRQQQGNATTTTANDRTISLFQSRLEAAGQDRNSFLVWIHSSNDHDDDVGSKYRMNDYGNGTVLPLMLDGRYYMQNFDPFRTLVALQDLQTQQQSSSSLSKAYWSCMCMEPTQGDNPVDLDDNSSRKDPAGKRPSYEPTQSCSSGVALCRMVEVMKHCYPSTGTGKDRPKQLKLQSMGCLPEGSIFQRT